MGRVGVGGVSEIGLMWGSVGCSGGICRCFSGDVMVRDGCGRYGGVVGVRRGVICALSGVLGGGVPVVGGAC